MADPVLRRVACAAVVYWEIDETGPRVSRLVVDCPLPVLEDDSLPLPLVPVEAEAALQWWAARHPLPPPPPPGPDPRPAPAVIETAQWEAAA